MTIGKIFLEIRAVLKVLNLLGANGDPGTLALTYIFGDRLRLFEFRARGRDILQADVCVAQAEVRHRQVGIQPQRLVERSGRFDPNEGIEICKSLIVEGLGF